MIRQTSGNDSRRRGASRLAGALGLLLALALIGGVILPAYAAMPTPPMAFAGIASTITPAEPVPAGPLVEAYVNGELRTGPWPLYPYPAVYTEAGGVYKNLFAAGPGGTVTFRVAGVLAQESIEWESGATETRFNLTIPELPPMTFTGIVNTITPPGPVPAGTLVQAYVGAELRAQTVTGAAGQYSNLQVPGPGGTVTFRVDGVLAQENTAWQGGAVESDFNLTVSALPVYFYSLTMAVNPTAAGTAADLTNDSPYSEGVEVSIEAVRAAGYQFANWTATAGTFADADAAETTFTMPAQNVTVTANFEAATEYTLTMVASPVAGGTATDLTGAPTYLEGEVVSIQASADSDYEFVNWTAPSGSFGDANTPTTSFTIPAQDVTVTANFELVGGYTLMMAASPIMGGTAYDVTGASPYAEGTVVSIQAIAASGYQFVGWTASAGSFANANALATTFTIPAQDVLVTATFQVVPTTTTGCFVATAAYGSPTAEQLDVVREFRDGVLLESAMGSQLVALYYRLSPPVADFISGNGFLMILVRELLVDPAVRMAGATGDIWRNHG
jgi:hypothetical protein